MPTEEPIRHERRYDFQINQPVKLPDPVIVKALELIHQDDVHSVSCAYDDPVLWQSLIAEQVRRSKASGEPPQDAFGLYGPDGGLWDTPVDALGGFVHIPYEGICGSDLYIRAKWRKFRVPEGTATGRLSTAASVHCCHYVLSPEDFGEVSFATRVVVGDWVLYKSNQCYQRCNPMRRKDDPGLHINRQTPEC